MANTPMINGSHGTQRKTLAAQLDRLDGIIDALAEGLNEAVADAVRQAVGAAVQQSVEAVLREVLARPELLRALAPVPAVPVAQIAPTAAPAPAAPAPAAPGPSPLRRCLAWLGSKVSGACAWLDAQLSSASTCLDQAIAQAVARARAVGSAAARALWLARVVLGGLAGWLGRHPATVALALSLGLTVGVASYLAGPLVCSSVLGLLGAVSGLAGSVLARLVHLLYGCSLPEHSAAAPGDADHLRF
jgi:hypothetical protein